MGVEVIDVVGAEAGFGEGPFHEFGEALSVGTRGDTVVALGAHQGGVEEAVDLDAAAASRVVGFKDEKGGSLAGDDAVPGAVEGTAWRQSSSGVVPAAHQTPRPVTAMAGSTMESPGVDEMSGVRRGGDPCA